MSQFKSTPHVENSHIIFQESLFSVQKDLLFIPPDTHYAYYSLITKPFAVVILATTSEGNFVLNEEYRHPTKTTLLGCPGGYIEMDEPVLEAAARELLEETGFKADSLEYLGEAYPYPGVSGQKTIYVRGYHAVQVQEPILETAEIVKPVLKSKADLLNSIRQGIHLDGALCTALFFYDNFCS